MLQICRGDIAVTPHDDRCYKRVWGYEGVFVQIITDGIKNRTSMVIFLAWNNTFDWINIWFIGFWNDGFEIMRALLLIRPFNIGICVV